MSTPDPSTLADDLDHLATSIGGDDPMGLRDRLEDATDEARQLAQRVAWVADDIGDLARLARSLSQDVALAAGDLAHLIGPYDAALGRIALDLCRVAGRLAGPPSRGRGDTPAN